MRIALAACALAVALAPARLARADEPAPRAPESHVGRRLLAGAGIGLGATLLGGVPLAASGANRDIAGPSESLMVSGMGLLLMSLTAALYAAAGTAGIAGGPAERPPRGWLELGYVFVDDPQFSYRNLTRARGALQLGKVMLRPSVTAALDDDNQRLELPVAYRLTAARPGDGSRLEVGLELVHHRYGSDGFAVSSAAARVAGRLDLLHVGPSLDGAFAELSAGVGAERTGYGRAADWNSMLLGRFAFGVYLGRGRGEARVYYDNRRDDYAGGLALQRGSGFIGYVGTDGHLRLLGRWSLSWSLERGAANIARIGVRAEWGR